MRCAYFSLPSGRIKSFSLISNCQEGNFILVDLELYQKLLETPYKIRNPYNVANRIYTIKDLSLFEPMPTSDISLGKDRLDDYENSIEESIINLNAEIIRVDGLTLLAKKELLNTFKYTSLFLQFGHIILYFQFISNSSIEFCSSR